jgi:hypothetical protein
VIQWAKNAVARYREFPKGIGPLSKEDADEFSSRVLKEGKFIRWMISLDVSINDLFLNGINNETISSHIGRAALNNKQWAIFFAKFLNLFEANHVAKSMAGDRGRGRNVVNLEDLYLQKDENVK